MSDSVPCEFNTDVEFYRVVIAGASRHELFVTVMFCHLPKLDWLDDAQGGVAWVVKYDCNKPGEAKLLYQLFRAIGYSNTGAANLAFGDIDFIGSPIEGMSVGVAVSTKQGISEVSGYFPVDDIPVVPLPASRWTADAVCEEYKEGDF